MAKNIFFIISALPILISQFLFFPAAWGKAQIFRALMILLIYVFVYYLVFKRVRIDFSKIKKIKVFWLLALLALFLILSTIFSEDPYFSFWGDPQRAGGSFNLILFLTFSLLAFLLIKKEQWQKLWDFNFIIASIVAVLAIIIPHNDRLASTMGGPPILGLYLALLIPLALSFFLKESAGRRKKIYLFYSAFFFLIILLTQSRGVLIGLLAGFLFFIMSYSKSKLWLKISGCFLILLLLAGIYALRPVNIQDRVSVWKISLEAVKEKPLLGYGPENFSIAFDKYYNNSLPGLNGQWFDRAHNIIFDLAVPFGVIFLIIYILIFAIIFLKVPSPAIKSCLIIYFVGNLFNFDVFSTYLIIFMLLAYSMSLIYENPLQHIKKEKKSGPFLQVAMVILFLLFFSFAWASSFKPLYINKEINEARYAMDGSKFDKILSEHSFIDNYARINYAINASWIISKDPSLKTSLPLIKKTISALKEASEIRPKYARTWYMLALFANTLSKYEDSGQDALNYCQKAKELSPNHPLIIHECSGFLNN
jgi:O-antigen ligase